MKKIFVLLLIGMILVIPAISAWDDCRFNEENCSYPGKCGTYVDTNKDGLCDSSQTLPQVINEQFGEQVIKNNMIGKYYFIPILIVILLLYGLSYFLVKVNKIGYVLHKKIWNLFLLISFLISGILGLLLVIRIEYGFEGLIFIDQLFWHVEFGIIMAIIAIFHTFWHLSYYKSYFNKKQ